MEIDRSGLIEKLERLIEWVANPEDDGHWYNDITSIEDGSDDRTAPVRALTDATIITEYLDTLIPELMEQAREDGETWTQIGETMGITRQAAQQRLAAFKRDVMAATT